MLERIRTDSDFASDQRLVAMAAKLKKAIPEVVGYLTCLYGWTARNRPMGNLTGLPPELVERAAFWEGEEGVFFGILRAKDVGFLRKDGVLSDWERLNGHALREQARLRIFFARNRPKHATRESRVGHAGKGLGEINISPLTPPRGQASPARKRPPDPPPGGPASREAPTVAGPPQQPRGQPQHIRDTWPAWLKESALKNQTRQEESAHAQT